MLVKKFIIAKIIEKNVITNVNNSNTSSYNNKFSFELNFKDCPIQYLVPLTISELNKFGSQFYRIEFDSEREAMDVLEIIQFSINDFGFRYYTILPIYINITDETEIRRLKSKEILTEE